MGMPAMKAYLGFREQEPPFGYKRFRPLAPKLTSPTATATATAATTKFDPKRFIRQESKSGSSDQQKQECTQVETHGASTRWNPTREQIGILEMVYKGGLRSPNAHQIEQITAQLAVYGRIEGKNVFYWFQNHKARDRQKQKRDALAHTPPSHFTDTSSSQLLSSQGEGVEEGMSCISQKRKSCLLQEEEEEEEEEEVEVGGDRTLKLFPLHPGGLK